jgi:hypothetical protein
MAWRTGNIPMAGSVVTAPTFGAFNPGTLDSFARAQGALGANWVSPWQNDPGTVSISSTSGRVSGGTTGANSNTAGYIATSFAADQEVGLTMPVVDTTGGIFIQLWARSNANTNTSTTSAYLLRVTSSTSGWSIRKKVGGAGTTQLAGFTQAIASGGSLGLRVTGTTTTTLTCYYKPSGGSWAQVGTVDDTSTPLTNSGYMGLTLQGTTARGGPFLGGVVPVV